MRGAATKAMSDIVEERQQRRYAPLAAAPLRAAASRFTGSTCMCARIPLKFFLTDSKKGDDIVDVIEGDYNETFLRDGPIRLAPHRRARCPSGPAARGVAPPPEWTAFSISICLLN
ncbi:MAG: hypothetical protein DMG08_27455 [Acidobacteria bacterium]|nr:MAG: hypothetical protein DMG08_27455 [Acidobacteriota bacterium]